MLFPPASLSRFWIAYWWNESELRLKLSPEFTVGLQVN